MRRRNLQFWRVTFPSSCCVSEIFSYFQASLKIKWETRTMERRYKKKRMKKLGRHTRLKKRRISTTKRTIFLTVEWYQTSRRHFKYWNRETKQKIRIN
jgi:hypothetical protein